MDMTKGDSIELAFSGNLSDISDELKIWSLLSVGLVAKTNGIDTAEYYTQLFESARQRLRFGKPRGTAADFADYKMVSPDRLDASAFEPIDVSTLTQPLPTSILAFAALVAESAPRTTAEVEGEFETEVIEFGQITGAIDLLEPGVAAVRRQSAVADVIYLMPSLRFDVSAKRMVEVLPDELLARVDRSWPAELTSERIAELQATARSEDFSFVLSLISTTAGALTWVPTVGPVFQLLQGLMGLVELIQGDNKENEYQMLLNGVDTIISRQLLSADIRTQLSNARGFLDAFNSVHSAYKSSPNPISFIKTNYLKVLNEQSSTLSGSLLNTVSQLWGMLSEKTASWNDASSIERLISAVALTLGYRMMVYRTKLLLHAALQAANDPDPSHKDSILDTLSALSALANYGNPSAWSLVRVLDDYKVKRFDPESVYWTYKRSITGTIFYVRDRFDNDKVLEEANFFIENPGKSWAIRTRDAHYNWITEAASKNVLPIRDQLIKEIDGYYRLNCSTRGVPSPMIKAAAVAGSTLMFFAEKQAARYNTTSQQIERASPFTMNRDRLRDWPEQFLSGIDAAVNWSENEIYVFKGNQYLVVGNAFAAVSPPQNLTKLTKFPIPYVNAVVRTSDAYYFVYGQNCLPRYIVPQQTATGLPWSLGQALPLMYSVYFKDWPPEFNDGVDGGFTVADYTYFWKGGRYVRYRGLQRDGGLNPIDASDSDLRRFLWWTYAPVGKEPGVQVAEKRTLVQT